MENTASIVREPSLDDSAAPAPKRRKLRKGTQSCWECKRRKARCTFSAATKDVCEGCKRRGTECVSQASADEPPPPGSKKGLVDRLGQVEALVGQLLKAARRDDLVSPAISESRRRNYRDRPSRSQSPELRPSRLVRQRLCHDLSRDAQEEVTSHPGSTSTTDSLQTTVDSYQDSSTASHYDNLRRGLLEAWPSPQDLDAILKLPIATSSIICAVTCTHLSQTSGSPPSSKTLLQLPPPGSHPTLVARKLLILATFLQGMPASSTQHLDDLSTKYYGLMSRLVKTAHNLVTCNDELVTSLEGLECILLEALFENYSGNLRRSWLAARRAVAIAQMMGLNRGVEPFSLDGASIKPDDMWSLLIQFDRYLCLMLGLPQSSFDDSYAEAETLDSCIPWERMHRLCTVACGRILRRNFSDMYDKKNVEEIGKILQEASTTMPAQYWVAPTIPTAAGHMERIRETLRFNDHFMYYHLLLQVHLPFLLRSGVEPGYEYNRMTAVTASREILCRFAPFREFRSASYYCRGVDLLVFTSSAALCLAHITDQRNRDSENAGFHFLAHQRLSDRGMLEQILGYMQEVVRQNDDPIAKRVVTLLRHLLAIEEDAASEGRYNVTLVTEPKKEEDLGCRVKLSDDDTVMDIYIPHFCVIRIEPQSSEKGPQTTLTQTAGKDSRPPTTTTDVWRDLSHVQPSPLPVNENGDKAQSTEEVPVDSIIDWEIGNFDMSFLDSFVEGVVGSET
ncbi:Zn(2)-C6 fungal-type domain-containing protein [Fusarium sp. LHS14.1]|nr:Zn(2)-C6 fungal-type domain-containing protein [Fusarium sp. LHS14.1]